MTDARSGVGLGRRSDVRSDKDGVLCVHTVSAMRTRPVVRTRNTTFDDRSLSMVRPMYVVLVKPLTHAHPANSILTMVTTIAEAQHTRHYDHYQYAHYNYHANH